MIGYKGRSLNGLVSFGESFLIKMTELVDQVEFGAAALEAELDPAKFGATDFGAGESLRCAEQAESQAEPQAEPQAATLVE